MAESGGLRIDTNEANGTPPVALEAPQIAALFLVRFDVRKGYTVTWQRSLDGVELEGVVDYKSLPSGLHNVEEDLVYFTHDQYVGVSSFLNKPGSESERNARMLAIGVLVPLENGRMGKSWRHAAGLKELAEKQIIEQDDFQALEQYWTQHKLSGDNEDRGSPIDSPVELRINKNIENGNGNENGYRSSRRISTATLSAPTAQSLSPHHPALSLSSLVQQFGPLLFLMYRAALLRKRILFVGEAPVERNCNFVYDLSVLSALPRSLVNILPIDGIPDLRLEALFSVGVQDIPTLSAKRISTDSFANLRQGWLACTTDDVLATKPDLFDLLVHLPPAASKDMKGKRYPQIVSSTPELSRSFPKDGLRSTQRDARRYRNLRHGLQALEPASTTVDPESPAANGEDTESTISAASSAVSAIVEPTSWSLMAYTSLIWWASAGEKRSGPSEEEEVENEQDAALLRSEFDEDEGMSKEVAIVAYFHRLTNLIFTTISDAISRADREEERYKDAEDNDDEDEDADRDGEGIAPEDNALVDSTDEVRPNEEGEALLQANGGENGNSNGNGTQFQDEDVEITPEDMTMMGLDVWSASDRVFVEELVALWWGRKVVVRGGRIECCGVRIL